MKRRTKTNTWTDEKREQARVRCLNQKPWEHTTGPKTGAGKSISAQNALKHGGTTADMVTLSNALWEQSKFIHKVMDMHGIAR